MQAINGYLENGRFIPNENVILPKRVQAVLVFNDEIEKERGSEGEREERLLWLKKFYEAVEDAQDEELLYIPRPQEMRPPVNFSEEE